MFNQVTFYYRVEYIRGRWVVFECSEYLAEEIFASTSREEVKAFMRDLGA